MVDVAAVLAQLAAPVGELAVHTEAALAILLVLIALRCLVPLHVFDLDHVAAGRILPLLLLRSLAHRPVLLRLGRGLCAVGLGRPSPYLLVLLL